MTITLKKYYLLKREKYITGLKEIGKNTEIIPSHCISSFYKYKRELNDKL